MAWPPRQAYRQAVTRAAPNIIACGIGEVKAETILKVATQQDFAFVSVPNADIGASIARFFIALTTSVVQSGRSLTSPNPELVVERPRASAWRLTSCDTPKKASRRGQQRSRRPTARQARKPG